MDARYQPQASQATGTPGGPHDDDMPPQALTGRSCCCPARAVVRIILPPTAGRPHETDLLLCGHHFRVSRRALAAAHAVVHEIQRPA